MINKNKDDNWSTWKANGILKLSALIKSNSVTVDPPFDFTSKNISTLTIKESNKDPQPTMLINDFDIDFLPSPLTRKPNKGNNGIK